MFLFIVPVSLSIGFYFLWQYLGISSLGVVAVIVIITPITVFVGRKLDKLQKNQMTLKDKRMAKISEILNSIKIIKLNAWEFSFMDKVNSLRKLELKAIRKIAVLYSIIDLVWIIAPMLLAMSCFAAYALINYSQFNATTIFVSLSILNLFGVPMAIIPVVFSRFVRATVSVRRLAKFLSAEELDDDSIIRDKRDNVLSIAIENATLKWSLEEEPVLNDLTMNVLKGSLVAVIGEVGAGKSSLLSAFMGDLYKMSGTIKVNGSLAYVPQSAWILNTSLKKNIIFMSNEDDNRYEEVISACALLPDLNILPAGDNTEIGEKGINLSGGQKQNQFSASCVSRFRYLSSGRSIVSS
jgi:ABC-type multidrug transport system fused ATPase/permease subunit